MTWVRELSNDSQPSSVFSYICFLLFKGFLKTTAMAKGVNGNKVKCVFYFPTDPGYRDTARMLVESGTRLGQGAVYRSRAVSFYSSSSQSFSFHFIDT
jgi:hypothetical protein